MGREVLEMGGVGRTSGKQDGKTTLPGGLGLGGAGMQGSRMHVGALRPSGQDMGVSARGREDGRKLAGRELLVSWGCCDKSRHSWWLHRTDRCCLRFLEPRV